MSKYRSSMPQTVRTGSIWSGPTPADIMAASGRASIALLFRSAGSGRRREMMALIGPAFWDDIDHLVHFFGRTLDGRFLIKGRMDSSSCLAVIERQPVQWATRSAS